MSLIRAMRSLTKLSLPYQNTSQIRQLTPMKMTPLVVPYDYGRSQMMMINTFEKFARSLTLTKVPKRPPNAYTLFFKEKFDTIKTENPALRIPELAKLIAKEWGSLGSDEKDAFAIIAKSDYDKYTIERKRFMKALTPQQKEQLTLNNKVRRKSLAKRRLKSELKKMSYPNRPLNAYALFVADVLKSKKTKDFTQIGQMWKVLSDTEKAKYEDMSKADKIRYLTQLEAWKLENKKPENMNSLIRLADLKAKSMAKLTTVKTKKTKKSAAATKMGAKVKSSEKASKKAKTKKSKIIDNILSEE